MCSGELLICQRCGAPHAISIVYICSALVVADYRMLPRMVCNTRPKEHGIAGNGWYDRAYCEVKNWHQSSKLVQVHRLWGRLQW